MGNLPHLVCCNSRCCFPQRNVVNPPRLLLLLLKRHLSHVAVVSSGGGHLGIKVGVALGGSMTGSRRTTFTGVSILCTSVSLKLFIDGYCSDVKFKRAACLSCSCVLVKGTMCKLPVDLTNRHGATCYHDAAVCPSHDEQGRTVRNEPTQARLITPCEFSIRLFYSPLAVTSYRKLIQCRLSCFVCVCHFFF